jgi:peptide-methionine (S)-S-oxide reductase
MKSQVSVANYYSYRQMKHSMAMVEPLIRLNRCPYRNHGSHAEAIEVVFEPAKLSYRELLEFFFQIHDPTTKNRQGNDIGTSYRSGIYYLSDEQRRVAEETVADVNASGLWPGPVVTEVRPAGPFWEAEPPHQDYLLRYPGGYTCHYPRPDWKLPRRSSARTA